MPQRNISPHLQIIQQIETTTKLSGEQREALMTLPLRVKQISGKSDVVRIGERPHEACVILNGLACRYKIASGGRRQILSLHFSGDMPDLHGLHVKTMDHAIGAITATSVAMIPHEAMKALISEHPSLADVFTRQAMIEGSIAREWILNLGQRTGSERIAHVICEVFMRLRALKLADSVSFRLPISQAELGEATGLTSVHVNRVLQKLRGAELIASQRDLHRIIDWEGLKSAGDFDSSYLHLRRQVLAA